MGQDKKSPKNKIKTQTSGSREGGRQLQSKADCVTENVGPQNRNHHVEKFKKC